jgi:hypothetical protein
MNQFRSLCVPYARNAIQYLPEENVCGYVASDSNIRTVSKPRNQSAHATC